MSASPDTMVEKALSELDLNNVPAYPSARTDTRPLDICRAFVAEVISSLSGCDRDVAYNSIQLPIDISNGDLAVTLPKIYPGEKPDRITEIGYDLLKNFPIDHPLVQLPFLEGVHFRIFLKLDALARIALPFIKKQGTAFGFIPKDRPHDAQSANVVRKRVLIESSSPNITSVIQGKHIRSTIVGSYLGSLYENSGWDVTHINYFGDWGKTVALLAIGWEKYGSEEAFAADAYSHLLEVYDRINEDFAPEKAASKNARDDAVKDSRDPGKAEAEIESKGIFEARNSFAKRMEEGDESALAFVKRVRDVNVEEYGKLYESLGTIYSDNNGESRVNSSTVNEVERILKEKKICEESGGSWFVDMRKLGAKSGRAIIRDRSGCTTYLLRDLAAALEHDRNYSFDKLIYVAGGDNSPHFVQVFKILEAMDMGELRQRLEHIPCNQNSDLIKKMGKDFRPIDLVIQHETAVKLSLKADEERSKVLGDEEDVIKALAISALRVEELTSKNTAAHVFDPVAASSFKSGKGPDLQYWFAKVDQTLAGQTEVVLSKDDYQEFIEEAPANLLRTLVRYPEVVQTASKNFESSPVVTFLANMTEVLADCIDNEETTPALAALYHTSRIVLGNGMRLLGVAPLSRHRHGRADTPIESCD